MRMGIGIVSALAGVVLGGCARVDVQKIGPDGSAVGPSGVRFNRARPYVVVNEPFIVSSRAYLVNGQVSPDGKFLLITTDAGNLDPDLRVKVGDKIEASRVLLSTSGGGLQSAPDLPKGLTPDELPKPGAPAGEGERPGPKPVEKTGQGTFKAVVDNAAAAVQPMRRYFDIAYLPDFEEEFVVQVKERMGNASATLTLGQGWSLQGLDARVDNDAITGRLLKLYDDSMKIAMQLGKAALGVPGVGGLQSAGDTANLSDAQLPRGTNVTIKVHLVRLVAPGIYPILKPAEGVYVQQNFAALKQLMPDLDRRILIPVYPMTNVAFNTYEVVVMEAAPAAGDSPLRMQQYIDAHAGGGEGARGPANPDGVKLLTDEGERRGMESQIAALLNAQEEDKHYTVTITPEPGGKQGRVKVTSEHGTLSAAKIREVIDAKTRGKAYTLTLEP